MRSAAVAFLTCLAVLALSAAGPSSTAPVQLSAQGLADLDRISAYLNRITTLQSGFVQIGPQGDLNEGQFYLEKPGRMRFAYNPPDPILIVAAGGTVTVKNSRLNTISRYSVSDTPLNLLLGDNIDLRNNRSIVGVEEQNGAVIVFARSFANRVQGEVTLVFSSPNIELRQWTVKDNEGLTTTIALNNLQTGMVLPDTLFVAPAKDPRTPKNPQPAKTGG